ncbi:FAD-dependent oxidoreductase [Deinococcus hohokamensis]|uniref:FAD-dependent oxidoreductase n=1 Tax=Deinococcus hohokamensis TaxID=309883 RepID=A0ABV9IAL0_9DEIO
MSTGQNDTAHAAGRVWAHVGQAFADPGYDVVVVGAGRMGAACAHFLRQLAPALRLLLLDEGGLPSEDGATILAPGVWSDTDAAPEDRAEARWVREQLRTAFGDVGLEPRPLLTLHAQEEAGTQPTAPLLARFPALPDLIDPGALPWAALDEQALTYRPGAVALSCGQQAVRHGADLMLNARATLVSGGIQVERLTVTNTHQVVTHETHLLRPAQVVVALGAAGPYAAEHDLGVHTAHARAYRQAPRLNVPSSAHTPVLRAAGLTLRPQNGGFTLVPHIHHRDPHGYVPQGGHLTGVPTGLRRETLEDLVALMDAVPVLATEALELGRSLSDVPGAWLALPGGSARGRPLHQHLGGGAWLLLGGPQADVLGLSTAYDLAATLAGVADRPWH